MKIKIDNSIMETSMSSVMMLIFDYANRSKIDSYYRDGDGCTITFPDEKSHDDFREELSKI